MDVGEIEIRRWIESVRIFRVVNDDDSRVLIDDPVCWWPYIDGDVFSLVHETAAPPAAAIECWPEPKLNEANVFDDNDDASIGLIGQTL